MKSTTHNTDRGPLTLKPAAAGDTAPEDPPWQAQWTTQKARVVGRVQGVYYRMTTKERAQTLGVNGYAKNMPDGSVEVIAHGHRDDVAELMQWLWQGPSGARVTAVTVEDTAAYGDIGFKTL